MDQRTHIRWRLMLMLGDLGVSVVVTDDADIDGLDQLTTAVEDFITAKGERHVVIPSEVTTSQHYLP